LPESNLYYRMKAEARNRDRFMWDSYTEKRMGREIAEAYERCLKRYPTIQISYKDFKARIEEILSKGSSPSEVQSRIKALALIHYEDLFLAMGCSRQDRVAWEHLADEYIPLLRKFSTQACGDSGEAEDLAQEIIVKMLKEGNRMSGYNGRGSLAGWLRATVAHAAVDRFRRARRLVSLEDSLQSGAFADWMDSGEADSEEALDSRWGPIISNAVSESISRLSARDRLVLGLYYLRGISLLAIGRQFRIHEATVSRWIERLRRDIRKQLEIDLRKKHGLRADDIRSLWKHISLSAVADPIAGTMPAVSDRVKNIGSTVPVSKKTARYK
jgi:RNA polymerase sigma-70 factor, ECF subfamily